MESDPLVRLENGFVGIQVKIHSVLAFGSVYQRFFFRLFWTEQFKLSTVRSFSSGADLRASHYNQRKVYSLSK
ncbi:unnamed protein product, partial [Nesidiocoris tenuis]